MIITAWAICVILGAYIGINKGYNPALSILVALVLGPLSLLMVFVSSVVKKCPRCAESVKREARHCKYCGHQFSHVIKPKKPGIGTALLWGTFGILLIATIAVNIKPFLRQTTTTATPSFTTATSAPVTSKIPTFNVERYCRRLGDVAGGSYQVESECLKNEHAALKRLRQISLESRIAQHCAEIGRIAGESYAVLETCVHEENRARDHLAR
jgi:hypothetical protein